MVKVLRFLKVLFSLSIIVLLFSAFYLYYFLHKPLNVGEKGYVFLVQPGMTSQKIAEALEKDKVMEHGELFTFWVRASQSRGKLQAGEYLVKPNSTPLDLIELLKSGKVIQHPFTIVPGTNFTQLMEALNQNPKLTHHLSALSPEEIMNKLGHPGEHPEGRFFPETYNFTLGTSDISVLQRAYKLMQEKLDKIWATRNPNLYIKTPYEALILASIIEKESSVLSEYGDIAGVYIRRLERKMPLAADPTVIYGVGKNYEGKITGTMLREPTPYNTYLNIGLPPTPIAMPGIQAIEAATHPKPGDTLYFVATKDGKGHVFSKTIEEHQTAVVEYRKNKNESINQIGTDVKIESTESNIPKAP